MPRFSAQHRFPKQRNAVLNFPQTIKHFPLHCLEENNARVSIKLRNLHENTSIQHHTVSIAPKRYISCCNSQQRQYFLPQQNENFVLEECLWIPAAKDHQITRSIEYTLGSVRPISGNISSQPKKSCPVFDSIERYMN